MSLYYGVDKTFGIGAGQLFKGCVTSIVHDSRTLGGAKYDMEVGCGNFPTMDFDPSKAFFTTPVPHAPRPPTPEELDRAFKAPSRPPTQEEIDNAFKDFK